MKILISGICGFVGSTLARAFAGAGMATEIVGLDNLSRPGSETNRRAIQKMGVRFVHGDLRSASDVDSLPAVDWIIDAAANPSVLAGSAGYGTSRQLMEHNLLGTINLLEHCRRTGAGFILLSTSRVYSIPALAGVRVRTDGEAFVPDESSPWPAGFSEKGIAEDFSTQAPVSLYGASKLASEALALEYGAAFDFPVWINRCGVLAGAGQFGKADQGIFSFWLHSHFARRPLRYIGFDGGGHQVRDCLHPRDLVPLLERQMSAGSTTGLPRVVNVSGGIGSARSLRQLSGWCDRRFAPMEIASEPGNRPYDLPWVVLDSSLAERTWQWTPTTPVEEILEEIARHAEATPDWLELSAGS
jgi:CDP-paratose 2-epimerase